MRILVACETSGAVADRLEAMGHFVVSCDILPSDSGRNNVTTLSDSGIKQHYQGNVLDILNFGWDMMIAHPPCTHLAVSGARWFHLKQKEQKESLEFVQTLMNAPIPRIAIENPVSIISSKIKKPDQIIQPWMFGHMETKATCLWLKNLPKLEETNNVFDDMMKLPKKERNRIHYLPPSADRWKLRSKTYDGIADCMAKSWAS